MIGKLNSIKSSNSIMVVNPFLDGKMMNLPTDLDGTSIKANFCW